MNWRRLPLLAALAVFFHLTGVAVLDHGPRASASPRVAKSAKGKAKARRPARYAGKARTVCTGKGAKRKCRRVRGRFVGHGVAQSALRVAPLPRPSGDIHVYAQAMNEEVRVNIYNPDGSFNQDALARLDHAFRCRRTREEHAVDPRLYEVLSIIYDNYGGRRIELMSGFRFQRNEGSRHFHGSAMDIRVPGVSFKTLYAFAESLDLGGMGIGQYPRADFVHVDFRAPGEPSYRWTDTRGHGSGSSGRMPSRYWKRSSRPNT
jgi:uncharacterized protein YcbK (DUF882 family)